MHSRNCTADTRGVSPVIGVVLLVGITVVLAGTVGAFAFGFDDKTSQGQVPTVAFQTDYDTGTSDELEFTHNSGETVDPQYLYVRVRGALCSGSDDPNGEHNVESKLDISDTFSAGQTITLEGDGGGAAGSSALCTDDLVLTGATVTVSWRTGTGTSSTVATWDGPA